MIIGFMFLGDALGENIIGFEAFYAIKKIYDCELHIFTNKGMQNLLQYCEFADLVTDIDITKMNKSHCDYLLVSNSKTKHIQKALQSNAKRVICATKPFSLFHYRCKTVPIYTFKKYRHLDERQLLLAYVRRINPSLYDSKIHSLDFTQASVQTGSEHKSFIKDFLRHALQNIPCSLVRNTQNLALHLNSENLSFDVCNHPNLFIEHANKKDDIVKMDSKNENIDLMPLYFIAINPFNNACPYSLSLEGYLMLLLEIAKLPYCIPCVATYPQVHDTFMQKIQNFGESLPREQAVFLQKVIICPNNYDYLNLAEFLSMMDCVISPSTGTIHLACNLRVQTIAIYPEYDTRRWATHNKKYVFVQTTKDKITAQEEENINLQVIALLKQMIQDGQIQSRHVYASYLSI